MSCFESILNHAQSVRAKLCDCNLDEGFDFAKNFFVHCFYVNYEGDQENVEKGFFKEHTPCSGILLDLLLPWLGS